MERIDEAMEAFQKVREFARDHSDQIISETDTRFQLLDRMLTEVLGWRRDGIRTEPKTDSGYIDYLLSSGGRNLFVVEAKRTGEKLVSTKLTEHRFDRRWKTKAGA